MNVTATLFGQMITFIVFVWFIKAYLWEPLTDAMESRTKKISDGLAAAEQGQKKIEQATIEFSTRIDEAKSKATNIITDAESKSKTIVEDARLSAREEAQKIAKTSAQQLEQEVNAAREKLKSDVAALSLLCAEKIISKEVDKNMHNQIINEVINK
jgi:F-type H+-transporting ATPase subunit b